MATTHHKVAVTTNFDNLVADALSIYARTVPLVCGHESLTSYIPEIPPRPVVAKIHRDLLLEPLNAPEDVAKLSTEWGAALTRILARFTPIVIGYGGNDGSLMEFLSGLERIEGGIFWCCRESNEPNDRIHAVVERLRGCLVPIAGFDEIMLQLQEKLELPSPLPQVQNAHETRVGNYDKQRKSLLAALRVTAATPAAEQGRRPERESATLAVEQLTKEKSWWAWLLRAEAESDPAKQEALLRGGIKEFPNSAELARSLADFLSDVRQNQDEAEQLYRLTLELDPGHISHLGNLATFTCIVRKNFDEAENLYRRALKIDPWHATNLGNLALFMFVARNDVDEAERLYRKALEIDPNHAANLGNYARFMFEVRKSFDEAEKLYRSAVAIEPNNADLWGRLAILISDVRQNATEAERLYRRALDIDPNHVANLSNLALLMERVRKFDEAERLFRRALDIEPNDANNLGDLATLIWDVHNNVDEAERLYRNALDVDPNQAINLGNFARFMADVRKNFFEAERLYRRAIHVDPKGANNLRNFALLMGTARENFDAAEDLFLRAIAAAPDDKSIAADYDRFRKQRR